jgi:GPH family glycoside/pentoside/hexuronide:cation symporter
MKVPKRVKWMYALGQLGWSILSGLIQVWLLWFYNPKGEANIPEFIPRSPVLGIFVVIGIITMVGRLMDAITDPYIANLSDKSQNPQGRRIPFMKKAILPFTILTILVFISPTVDHYVINIIWLTVTLLLYYIFYTMYVAPYFALTTELGETKEDRIDLSTYIALTWFLGYIIASGASLIWPIFENMGYSTATSIRITVAILAVLGFIFMLFPIFGVDEKKYVKQTPSTIDFKEAIKVTLKNKNFIIFQIFFLAYGIAITIFQSGNVYYVTLLLKLPPSWVTVITALTGILAFSLYPLVNKISKKIGKKQLCMFAMGLLIVAYIYCAFLGFYPFSPQLQAIVFVCLAGVGFAIFGILPNAICADIAHQDGIKTNSHRAGMYFSIQTFMNKLGQMIAMVLFTSILLIGGQESVLGVRLTGVAASVIGLAAMLIFTKFKEIET